MKKQQEQEQMAQPPAAWRATLASPIWAPEVLPVRLRRHQTLLPGVSGLDGLNHRRTVAVTV